MHKGLFFIFFSLITIPPLALTKPIDPRLTEIYNLLTTNEVSKAEIKIRNLVQAGIFNTNVNSKLLVDLGNKLKEQKKYSTSCNAFKDAYNLSNDKKIRYLIDNCQTPDSKYIVQVGAFLSGSNANNIIRKIIPPIDKFTLIKQKHRGFYFVYFDNFQSRQSADKVAEKLKSLNNNINIIVIDKAKFLK